MHSPTMAKLPRIATSGNNRTKAELYAFDISIVPQTKAEVNDLPAPTESLPLGFMTNESRETAGHRQEGDVNSPLLELAVNLQVGQAAG